MDKAPPSADVSAMQPFSTYVGSIEQLVGTVLSSGFDGLHIQTTRALDGEPGEALRESIDLYTRRSIGAFFSGSDLSDALVNTLTRPIDDVSRILDPACGSGDLLLACSRRLPIAGNLSETLKAWGQQLFGLDLYPEFIRAARARLVLAAALRGRWDASTALVGGDSWFPGSESETDWRFLRIWPKRRMWYSIPHLTSSRHRKGLSGPVGKSRQQPYS